MTMGKEREAFEKWLRDNSVDFLRTDNGHYSSAFIDGMLRSWQARAKLTTPETLQADVVDYHLLWIQTCLAEYPGEKSGAVRAALDYITSALAAMPPQSGWQPIDSAPRDGTPILMRRDTDCGHEYVVAHWYASPCIAYPWHAGSDAYSDARFDEWMPLPQPPQE